MTNQYIRNSKVLFAFVVIVCLSISTYANEDIKRERPSKLFSPSKIPLLEDPERDTWQKPEEILNALEIEKGQVVADIGAGSGYLTVKISERVGETGTVYAVDVQQEMMDYLRKRIDDKGFKNIILIMGDRDDPKLPPDSLDVAILLSTY